MLLEWLCKYPYPGDKSSTNPHLLPDLGWVGHDNDRRIKALNTSIWDLQNPFATNEVRSHFVSCFFNKRFNLSLHQHCHQIFHTGYLYEHRPHTLQISRTTFIAQYPHSNNHKHSKYDILYKRKHPCHQIGQYFFQIHCANPQSQLNSSKVSGGRILHKDWVLRYHTIAKNN